MAKIIIALRSLLSFALAFAMVWLVNAAGSALATLLGFPPGGQARLAWDLAWLIAAGMGAGATIASLAPCAPRGHVIAFFAVALVIDAVAIAQLGEDWPWWFNALTLLSLPLQAWSGIACGLRLRRPLSRGHHADA